jgi:hypothetical protein
MTKHYWHKGDKNHKFWQWVAFRLPRKLVLHATLRLIANACTGEYANTIVPKLTAMDACERWKKSDN